MSGLERTADALLERKAVQQSNHQRAQARIDDSVLKIRTHIISTKAAAGDIARLRDEVNAQAEEFSATDEAAALLADRHALQTISTNEETEKSVAFGKAFKELHEVNGGLLDRVLTAIDVGAAMSQLLRDHGRFLATARDVGHAVEALAAQRAAVAACNALAGHSPLLPLPSFGGDAATVYDEESAVAAADDGLHPLLSWWRHAQHATDNSDGEDCDDASPLLSTSSPLIHSSHTTTNLTSTIGKRAAHIASSTAEWDRHAAAITAETAQLTAETAAARAEKDTLTAEITAAREAIAVAKARRADVAARTEALKAEIAAAEARSEAAKAARAAVESEVSGPLSAAADSLRTSVAEKLAANAALTSDSTTRCTALEAKIATVCDTKHATAAACDTLSAEQTKSAAAVTSETTANADRRRAVLAKAFAARRIESLHRSAARRVLAVRAEGVAAAELLAADEGRRDALGAFYASKEAAAEAYEWSVAHAKESTEQLAALVAAETEAREAIQREESSLGDDSDRLSFALITALAAASAEELTARSLISADEEPRAREALAAAAEAIVAAQLIAEAEAVGRARWVSEAEAELLHLETAEAAARAEVLAALEAKAEKEAADAATAALAAAEAERTRLAAEAAEAEALRIAEEEAAAAEAERKRVAEEEEAAEAEAQRQADAEAAEAAAAALLAARKRPREPSFAASQPLHGVSSSADLLLQAPQSSQQHHNTSSSLLLSGSGSNSVLATPSRTRARVDSSNAIAATPSRTLANAHALLANTSSLLLEASKPIQPMMVSLGGAAAGAGGVSAAQSRGLLASSLVTATPRRGAGPNAALLMTPSGRAKGAIPLPPTGTAGASHRVSASPAPQMVTSGVVGTSQPLATAGHHLNFQQHQTQQRDGSEESVISLFRSVSMPQQPNSNNAIAAPLTVANLGRNAAALTLQQSQHLPQTTRQMMMMMGGGGGGGGLLAGANANNTARNNANIPSAVANWTTVPPSPTPTDLGAFAGGAAGRLHPSSGETPAIAAAPNVGGAGGKRAMPMRGGALANASPSPQNDDSEDEISLSRLLQPQAITAVAATVGAQQPSLLRGGVLVPAQQQLRGGTAARPSQQSNALLPPAPAMLAAAPTPTQRLSGGKRPIGLISNAVPSAAAAVGVNGGGGGAAAGTATPRRTSGRTSGGSGGAAAPPTATGRTSPSPRRPARKGAAAAAVAVPATPMRQQQQQQTATSGGASSAAKRAPFTNITNVANNTNASPIGGGSSKLGGSAKKASLAAAMLGAQPAAAPPATTVPATQQQQRTTPRRGSGRIIAPSAINGDDFNAAFGL